jgi:nicotinate-nucleotide--dimethylbenzimidazole phosphoribosyltransferase
VLEQLAEQICLIQRSLVPSVAHKTVLVFAADHGVARQGVSAYPPEVTPQMVLNFLNGGAAINVMARQVGARVVVADVGVDYDFDPDTKGLTVRKVRRGTDPITEGPAMTRDEAQATIEAGIDIAAAAIADGAQLIATGDMGIGNTTPSAAITACLTGKAPELVTGRGTGVDDAGYRRKVTAVEKAFAVNLPDPTDPVDVLAGIGGLEIGAICGAMLGAAALRVPILVDGFISGAGALLACALNPAVKGYLIAGHQSVEPGHRAVLDHLGLRPLLSLDMRLGEGTGAVLAMNVVEASVRVFNEMATFADAGVSGQADG